MDPIKWITLALAVLGAALGVFNTVTGYRRGRRRLSLKCDLYQTKDGITSLRVKVINPGYEPVLVEDLVLAGNRKSKPRRFQIRTETGNPSFPVTLKGGAALTFPISAWTLHEPLVRQMFTVRVEAQDGLRVELVYRPLRQLAKELQMAAAESGKQ